MCLRVYTEFSGKIVTYFFLFILPHQYLYLRKTNTDGNNFSLFQVLVIHRLSEEEAFSYMKFVCALIKKKCSPFFLYRISCHMMTDIQ